MVRLSRIPRLVWTALLLLPTLQAGASGYLLASFGAETESVVRGRESAGPSLNLALDFGQGPVYAGFSVDTPIYDQPRDRQMFEAYTGFSSGISPLLTLDAGVIGYDRNPAGGAGLEDTLEAFAGLSLEYLFRPRLFVYYDVKQERFAVEATASKLLEMRLPGDGDLYLEGRVGSAIALDGMDPSWSWAGAGLRYQVSIRDSLTADIFVEADLRDREMDSQKTRWLRVGFSFSTQF